jgi:nucleotide-binding universal stress UspA family protein
MRPKPFAAGSGGVLDEEAVRPGTLIVASDGGDESEGALAVGRTLASRLGAALEVVSVLEPTNVIVPPIAPAHPPLHRGATRIQDRRDRLRDLCGRVLVGEPQCSTRLLIGDVPSSIALAAQEHDARLVLTGRMEHGRLERAMRRETALATAESGRVPVLAVPESVSALPRVAVVAVREGQAAARASAIARVLLADAVAVHLVSVKPVAPVQWESDQRIESDAFEQAAGRAFGRAMAAWDLPRSVPVDTHVLAGDAGDVLPSFATTCGADLMVVGISRGTDRGRGPRRDLATRLYRSLACAALIVPVERRPMLRGEPPTAISVATDEWRELLRALSLRNVGRIASLFVEEEGQPVRSAVSEWMFAGAAFDPRPGAVEIMLADPAALSRHLTHVVDRPTVLAFHSAPSGSDDMLVVGYAGGQVSLTFS